MGRLFSSFLSLSFLAIFGQGAVSSFAGEPSSEAGQFNEVSRQLSISLMPPELFVQMIPSLTLDHSIEVSSVDHRFLVMVKEALKQGQELDLSGRKFALGQFKKLFSPASILAEAANINLSFATLEQKELLDLPANIKALSLRGKRLTFADPDFLSRLIFIRSLDLSSTYANDRWISQLSVLPQLKNLNLNNNGITDAGAAKLAERSLTRLPQIEILDLGQNVIQGAGSLELAKMTELKSLKLSGNYVNRRGLRAIATLPKLRFLDVSFNPLKGDDFDGLENAFSLQHLTVGGGWLDVTGYLSLSRALSQLTQFESLRISSAFIRTPGAKFLADLKQLKRLSVGPAMFVDPGVIELLRRELPNTQVILE